MVSQTLSEYRWLEAGVIYQIYPRSFQDSDVDGVGDLVGIERRLDYLVSLGIDAIWLSPIYPSPMGDFGYDVADYCGIDPMFGDLNEFDRLLTAVHARRLKLLLDFVPNHSSDQHPWFVESRSSRENPKRDWYIWRDPSPGGGPPNNWISDFGGSSWQWDEIGIGEVPIPRDRVQDPQDLRQPELGIGRDRSRTPIPWDDSAYAGFSTVDPWLPLNDDWRERNVAAQDRDPNSLLSLYQTLLSLRRSHTALVIGAFVLVDSAGDVLSFERQHDDERLLIALNLGNQTQTLPMPSEAATAKLLCSTAAPRPLDGTLAPNEGLVLQLRKQH